MDIERAVDDFVSRGKNLFHHLRSEGESLSDLGLRILRVQLHILHVETARLVHIKLARPTATAETSPALSPVQAKTEKKSPDECVHRRLIDDCVNALGERTGLVYCLECEAIIKDPFLKPE
jgi:hypothetical protein